MLSCLLNNKRINCCDGTYSKEQLKRWAQKKILVCPACGKLYEYCHGKVKSPYFRHMDKEECEDKYSEAETEEHIRGKQDLYEWVKTQPGVRDVVLEGWIAETKQKPDILFTYFGQQCVLEYQCSPISSEYYERHSLYQAAGINDIWICGTQKYFQCYHKGRGEKNVNVLEGLCGLYYDSISKKFYQIDKNIKEKEFKNILLNKNTHLMSDPTNYIEDTNNYYLVKDRSKSYFRESYYPSGRPSNKYRYPVTKYSFLTNVSLAKCMSFENFTLRNIKQVVKRCLNME